MPRKKSIKNSSVNHKVKEKKPFYKKISFIIFSVSMLLIVLILNLPKSGSDSKADSDNDDEIDSVIYVTAKDILEDEYNLANIKFDYNFDKEVMKQLPTQKDAETGEEYENVYQGFGRFEHDDKYYIFNIIFSFEEPKFEGKRHILTFNTNYNENKSLYTELEDAE